MSHAGRISTVAPSVTRRPAHATLALVLAFVVAVTLLLAATGPGAGTQSRVVSDGPRGSDAGAVTHPRAAPPVRVAPSRGSAAIAPQR